MSERVLLSEADATAHAIRRRKQKVFLKKQRHSDLGKALFLVIFLFVMFRFVFGFCVVYGNAMDTAAADGDILLFYRLQSAYESGDVIVYEAESISHVGRIAAGPGDTVMITEEGRLVVNGYTQNNFSAEEAYAAGTIDYTNETALGDDEYLILADDPTSVEDSRSYGAVSETQIQGLVITLIRRRNI